MTNDLNIDVQQIKDDVICLALKTDVELGRQGIQDLRAEAETLQHTILVCSGRAVPVVCLLPNVDLLPIYQVDRGMLVNLVRAESWIALAERILTTMLDEDDDLPDAVSYLLETVPKNFTGESDATPKH